MGVPTDQALNVGGFSRGQSRFLSTTETRCFCARSFGRDGTVVRPSPAGSPGVTSGSDSRASPRCSNPSTVEVGSSSVPAMRPGPARSSSCTSRNLDGSRMRAPVLYVERCLRRWPVRPAATRLRGRHRAIPDGRDLTGRRVRRAQRPAGSSDSSRRPASRCGATTCAPPSSACGSTGKSS